ncbi:MAG: protein-L-isoaspartate O-methyltransferase, partial [Saprospiraceae bacterium]
LTAAATEIPQQLINQLKPGGIMVAPLGSGDIQQMKRIIKNTDNTIREENFGNYRFVPFLKGIQG